ncbi:MAG: tetratricopeptide repeat protein [Firmicutes bacterium]|nr:tetratricopeptide repeat protein [Bacillota bacterium]
MQNKAWKNIIFFLAFIVLTVILFKINALLGLLFFLGSIILFLFNKRATIFALLGRTSYYKGNMEKGLVWFERAYKTGIAKPHTVTSYAYLLLKSGKIEEAEKILENLLRSNLNEDDKMLVKSNMALVYWKKGNLDDAIKTLEEVISSYETTNVYGSLGYMLIQKGDMDKALEFNLKAYDYNNSNAIILDNLGQTYYLRHEYDKAFEIYEKLMALNPSFPEAYYNYALVLKAKGENEKALETVKKALGYRLSFLSTIQKEDIDTLIKELEKNTKS